MSTRAPKPPKAPQASRLVAADHAVHVPGFAPIDLPPHIAAALDAGGLLAISVSGGKDSQAMLRVLAALARHRQWRVIVVHADLGRAEWRETPVEVERQAAEAGVPLHLVRRARGDLFARFEERLEKTDGQAPFWPDAKNRYCTSDLKRDPINTFLRGYAGVIVSAEGIRAEESAARGKKPCWEARDRITTQDRTGITWRPIRTWTLADVWAALGTSIEDVDRRRAFYQAGDRRAAFAGWQAHPAYVYGNRRLSCAFCVLADANDLEVGARHNPETLDYLVQLERRGGYTFKQGYALADLQARMAVAGAEPIAPIATAPELRAVA